LAPVVAMSADELVALTGYIRPLTLSLVRSSVSSIAPWH